MNDAVFVYVTASSREEAQRIGRAAVEERLAACANILPGMRSIYRWQGAVEEADEIVLILKTRADRIAALTQRVKALHSYAVPCVAAFPVTPGNPDYFAWIAAESAAP
jgi:periplasmic divalent cation tolerance protein